MKPENKPEFRNFAEFWPFYLQQHSKASTRAFHFVGTSFVFVCIALAIIVHPAYLILAPVIAYSFAWYSHFFVEGNKPATFGHPLWSLLADFKMWFFMATGQLNKEMRKLHID